MADEPKYEPLSAEEKAAIIERHKELVDRINRSLEEGQKILYDADLEKKLDDPKLYGVYRIGQQIAAKMARQRQIHANLESRFGRSRVDPNPLGRAIYCEFDTSGTEAANQYNERLYQDFITDPAKVIFMRYGKLLDTNPQEIANCGDDPLKLAEYYRDTYPLCEEGFVFNSIMRNGDLITPEMRTALTSITKPMEVIGYPVNMIRAASSIDYLAFPKLTLEQSLAVQNNDREWLLEGGDRLKRILDEPLVAATNETPQQYFGHFTERGIPLEKGMFVKYRPERFERDAEGNPINPTEIGYDAVFNAREGDNVRITTRDEANLFHVSAMSRSFQSAYLDKWQKTFNQKRNYIGEFDIDQIERQHRGGFLERYVFFSTSRQYKRFLQAFKDYNDPNSPNYLNKKNLKEAGDAYMARKRRQGYADVEHMRGTSKARGQFVLDAIASCDDTKAQDVAKEYLKDYAPEIQREPFLKSEDVIVDSLGAPAKEKEKAVEKTVEVKVENEGPERTA